MTTLTHVCRSALRLTSIAILCATPCFAAGISATATYTAAADPTTPGVYDYNLTLNNTGTTTIGTYWFSWIPGGDFLSATPTSITSPAGWSSTIISGTDGKSIRWVTTTSLLAAGQSLTGFSFDSTETPAQLLLNYTGTGKGLGLPVLTSFVYSAAPLADPGSQFITTAATPEPGTMLLTLTGLGMIGGSVKQRFLRRA